MKRKDSLIKKIWDCAICRTGMIILASLLVLLFFLSVLANPVLNYIIRPDIIKSINGSNNINLQIETLDFSLFQNKVSGYQSSLSLIDSSDSHIDTAKIHTPVIAISGINWFNLVTGKGYSFGDIIIEKPQLRLNSYIYSDDNPEENTNYKTDSVSFAQKLINSLPDDLKPFKLGSIKINSADIVRVTETEDRTIDSVKSLSIIIKNIYVDKTDNETEPLFENFELSAKDLHKRMEGSGYDFTIGTINLSSDKSGLIIKDIFLKPFIPDKDFFKGDIYRADRMIINIPEVELFEPDFVKFFNDNLFKVKKISIPRFHIEIFTNRRLPVDPSARPKMLHELISSLGFKIEAEKFETDNSVIILESVMPDVDRRAHLEFTNVKASISNISNTLVKQSNKTPCIIDASGNFMNESKLKIRLRYNLLSENLNFSYEGSIDEMELALLNSHLEVEDKTKIKSGKIITANFSAEVNNGISSVNIIPLYKDLKIEVLEEESIEELWLPTLLASVKIRSSNPDEEGKIKSANISYTRKPTDTFMDVIWLAVLKGIGEVVGF